MLKKTMTYTDFDGEERTEDFYFNLTKSELMEMELSTEGGMGEKIQSIINAKDVPSLIGIFKDIIMKSYGVKSPDGRKFVKNKEVLDDFMQTQAFSDLFMELSTNTDAATEFVNKVIPQDAPTQQ